VSLNSSLRISLTMFVTHSVISGIQTGGSPVAGHFIGMSYAPPFNVELLSSKSVLCVNNSTYFDEQYDAVRTRYSS
jgi:hypothetical protein